MPLIDVSLAIASPMLADQFTVLRRAETVNGFGESTVNTTTITPCYGTVQSAGSNDLERLPEDQRQGKHISIVTLFMLQGEVTGFQPDIVQWPISNGGVNADNYVIVSIDDYSQHGPGFIQAIAKSIDLTDNPPSP
jgi:hypothetical protein